MTGQRVWPKYKNYFKFNSFVSFLGGKPSGLPTPCEWNELFNVLNAIYYQQVLLYLKSIGFYSEKIMLEETHIRSLSMECFI